ncbi:MAG: class I SAM-dependent methyltransferase [Candidatus Omnitrophica bacterium]|nr:class I SAM-dependent methyltransferase [Candidatus Omnitrophota bacterium]
MSDLTSVFIRYPHIKNKIYILIKWLIFPFKQMEKYLPKKGEIVDVGCGEGLLSVYLSLRSKKRRVYGIDTDRKRIELAKKAAKGITNLQFFVQDALSWKKRVDAVVVSDVFHHFSPSSQEKFLKIAQQVIKKNGCLVIKEINKSDFIRARLSRLWDYILYPGDKINYWTIRKLVNRLKKLDFKVKVFRASLFLPASTIVYVCSKR